MRSTRRTGFTLIEMLIVVVVIGLLAAIAIPKFQTVRESSYEATLQSDLKNLSSLQEIYQSRNFVYTADQSALGFTASQGVAVSVGVATATGWSASATHSGTSSTCALFYGDATAVAPAVVAGVLTCN